MSDDPELKRIRWRCRRGMRELDQLFESKGVAYDKDAADKIRAANA